MNGMYVQYIHTRSRPQLASFNKEKLGKKQTLGPSTAGTGHKKPRWLPMYVQDCRFPAAEIYHIAVSMNQKPSSPLKAKGNENKQHLFILIKDFNLPNLLGSISLHFPSTTPTPYIQRQALLTIRIQTHQPCDSLSARHSSCPPHSP